MGKSKKIVKGDAYDRPGSLANQLTSNGAVSKSRKKNQLRNEKNETADTKKVEVVDEFLTKKILKQARKQQKDVDKEDSGDNAVGEVKRLKTISLRTVSDEEAEDDDDLFDFSGKEYYEPEIDEDDEKALEEFMLHKNVQKCEENKSKKRLLCDLILSKIEEKRFELESQMSQSAATDDVTCSKNLDPRLVEMYKNVGKVLSTYRSGKVPKPFKIVPKLTNWEQILYLTEPEKWTAAAMYQATKIFVSNLNVKMCQRFLSLILLPRVRDDITEYKKLNFHLYQALGKALFKPAAFFKAILLPLCESGTCTLREATIIGSLLTKCSIPSLHSSAAMLKMAEMEYGGANSLFLRLLIDKKYTLPFRVIDGLVNHFLRFVNDSRQLPVLWHQSLLALCQRYKHDLSMEQKENLLDLIKKHYHHQISPEIRRELTHAEPRDVEDQQPQLYNNDDDMDE